MEFAESTDKEKPIPKELTAFLNEVQNNLGLYPETVIYNRIKEYISVIPRKQVAWLTQTVIISTEFRVRILSTRCKSGDKLACEMLDLAVNGEYSKNPTVQKGLMGLFRDENDIESGKLLVEIGVITQEQYDKEIRSRKQGDLIDGKSYPDLLNDLAAESKKYPTADSFSMAMIMGKLESVPSPNTANVYKLIRGKYKTAEDFYNAVKKGEFELKKTEERKERMVEPEEAVSRPLIIKGVEDLELMKKEIQDKITEEKRRRLRGGGMAGEPAGEYHEDPSKEERLKVARAIAATAAGPVEPTAIPVCPQIPGFVHCPACKFKYSVTSILVCPFRPEPTRFFRESNDVYSRWTYDDFKIIINQITNIEDLMDLAKRIEDSRLMTPGEKVSARQLADKRKRDIVYKTPEIKRQIVEQERGGQFAAASRLRDDDIKKDDDVMHEPPEDYKLWTFADFEPFIYNEDDIDELGQLQGIVNLSNRLTETEKTELHDLIDKQIGEIIARR